MDAISIAADLVPTLKAILYMFLMGIIFPMLVSAEILILHLLVFLGLAVYGGIQLNRGPRGEFFLQLFILYLKSISLSLLYSTICANLCSHLFSGQLGPWDLDKIWNTRKITIFRSFMSAYFLVSVLWAFRKLKNLTSR